MSNKIKKRPTRKANGEGTIYFSDSKRKWIGQIVLGRKEDGSAKRISRYGKTKAEVRQKLKEAEWEYQTGTYIDKSKITVKDLAEITLKEKLNLNKIQESTYHRHTSTLKELSPIANIPLQELTITQIKKFLFDIANEYSQSSINKQFQMLKKVFAIAKKRKIISENFFDDEEELQCPRSSIASEKVRALTVDEQKKLCELLLGDTTINYRHQMLLSMFTGMRMGEINALNVSDINTTFKAISVTKTISRGEKGEAILSNQPKTIAGERILHYSDIVESIINECLQIKKSGFLFQKNGKLITTNQVNNQFQRVIKKYNILDPAIKGKVSLHSLRHTYATRCIESGMPAKVLQGLLGHTDIRITLNTYCDVFNKFETEHISGVENYLKSVGITFQTEIKKNTPKSKTAKG